MLPAGITPLTHQRFNIRPHTSPSTPVTPHNRLFHTPLAPPPATVQQATPATPAIPSPAASVANNNTNAPLQTVTGFNAACPPALYVFKDKECPYRYEGAGCAYRTHITNLLTRHVRRKHNANYRQEHRQRARRVVPADDEDEQVPTPRPLAPIDEQQQIRRRVPPADNGQAMTPPRDTMANPSTRTQSTQVANPSTHTQSTQTIDQNNTSLQSNNQYTPPPGRSGYSPLILSTGSPEHSQTPPQASANPDPEPASTPTQSTPALNLSPPTATSTPIHSSNRSGQNEIVLRGPPPPQTQHEYDEDDLMQTTKIRSAQLSENFTMMVCGPSGAGKTMFIAQLITHRKTLCEKPPVYIVIVYCNPDPKLIEYGDTNINVNDSKHQYTKDYLMKLFVKTATRNVEGTKAAPSLIVFDDCQNNREVVEVIIDLVTGTARHSNISVIYVAQQLYKGPQQHAISANIKYLTLFKNHRFLNEITTLNTQILPGQPGVLAAMIEKLDRHDHLLIHLFADNANRSIKYRVNIFRTEHVIPVFVVRVQNHL